MIYGYMRVSSRTQEGNHSFESQKELIIKKAEALKDSLDLTDGIYSEVISGSVDPLERPCFRELYNKLQSGDTLIVAKLDRLARSLYSVQGLLKKLNDKKINVYILDIPMMESCDESTGTLVLQIFGAFAEWERSRINRRMQEGRRVAKERAEIEGRKIFGRPRLYKQSDLDYALELLKNYTYNEVTRRTGISKSTLIREVRRLRDIEALKSSEITNTNTQTIVPTVQEMQKEFEEFQEFKRLKARSSDRIH